MATQTTQTAAQAWRPDVTTHDPGDAVPDALVLQTSNVIGEVEGDAVAVRVAYIDDADATFIGEGNEIPESDPPLSECVVHTGKVSQLVRLSNEQWRQAATPEQLAESVRRAVTKAANLAYITQVAPEAPAVTPPAGLLNVTGITDGGQIADSLDALVDGIATLTDNGAEPTHIISSATAWARLRKLRIGTDFNATLIGPGVMDTELRLLDLPVIVSPAVPAGTLIVLDKRAIVSAVGPVKVATSEHADFRRDGVMIRATWRVGSNIVRPNRIAHFTVAEPTLAGEDSK